MVKFPEQKLKIDTLSVRQDAALTLLEGVNTDEAFSSLARSVAVLTVMEVLKKITPESTGKQMTALLSRLDIS